MTEAAYEPTAADWDDFGAFAEADKRDAARYRYLKSIAYVAVHPHHHDLPKHLRTGWVTKLIPESGVTLDSAVDAAIAKASA